MANPAPGFTQHPNHSIVLEKAAAPVNVLFGGEMVAQSDAAVLLREDRYPLRAYLPRTDVTAALRQTEKTTHCPFKGDTAYFDVMAGDTNLENAAWLYRAPFDEVALIKDHVAFDDRFELKVGESGAPLA